MRSTTLYSSCTIWATISGIACAMMLLETLPLVKSFAIGTRASSFCPADGDCLQPARRGFCYICFIVALSNARRKRSRPPFTLR